MISAINTCANGFIGNGEDAPPTLAAAKAAAVFVKLVDAREALGGESEPANAEWRSLVVGASGPRENPLPKPVVVFVVGQFMDKFCCIELPLLFWYASSAIAKLSAFSESSESLSWSRSSDPEPLTLSRVVSYATWSITPMLQQERRIHEHEYANSMQCGFIVCVLCDVDSVALCNKMFTCLQHSFRNEAITSLLLWLRSPSEGIQKQ